MNEKKCFLGAKETHFLLSGHRSPHQLENALKSGGTVFFHTSLGLNIRELCRLGVGCETSKRI